MAVTVVGTAVSDGNTGFGSSDVSGAANGDRAFIIGSSDNTQTAAISGWTQIYNDAGFDGSSGRCLYYKDLTSSDVSASISGTNTDYSFIMVVVTGHDSAIDPTSTTYYTLGSIDVDDLPSHGSFVTGDLSLIGAHTQDATTSVSSPTGYSTAVNNSATTGTQHSVTAIAYRNDVSGTVNPGQWSGRPNGQFMGNPHIRVPQASSGITGTLAKTEANDTVSSSGKVKIESTVAKTEAADTITSVGVVNRYGTAAITETDDTLAGVSTLQISATTSRTEDNDTSTGASTLQISGTVSVTEDNDLSTGASDLTVLGTVSYTEDDDTLSSEGTGISNGTVSYTEDNDTAVSEGNLYIFGMTVFTEDDDTSTGVGALGLIGMGPYTEEDDTLFSEATMQDVIYGLVAYAEESDTAASEGFLKIIGTVSITEEDDTSTGSSTITKEGTVSYTEEDDTLESTSYVSSVGFRHQLWDTIGIIIGP